MKNLMQARSLIVAVVIIALLMFASVIIVTGVNEQSAPTLATVIGHVGTLIAILVAASKIGEAATNAKRAAETSTVAAEKSSVAADKAALAATQTNGQLERIVSTAEKQTAIANALVTRTPHGCHDPLCELKDGA